MRVTQHGKYATLGQACERIVEILRDTQEPSVTHDQQDCSQSVQVTLDGWQVRASSSTHKAFIKSLQNVEKVSPNTRIRKLQDFISEVEFYALLHFNDHQWQNDPTSIQGIIITTFNTELKRLFLSQRSYVHSTWTTLTEWLHNHTDQTPDDLRLQALEKLRGGQCKQGKRTLAEYNTYFQQQLHLSTMDHPTNTQWIIQTYISGLTNTIRDQIWMNPLTNKHWTTLQEVQDCAYRLSYQWTKSSASLNVMQEGPRHHSSPPPRGGRGSPSSRSRSNRSAFGRGTGSSSKGGTHSRHRQTPSGHTNQYGISKSGHTNQYDASKSGYTNQHGATRGGHTNTSGRGGYTHPSDKSMDFFQPRPRSAPGKVSAVNKSMWVSQENKLKAVGACSTCFSFNCKNPCPNQVQNIWDAPRHVLERAGVTLTTAQKSHQFPIPSPY